MARSTTASHPIATLREQVTALEAAITQCLADPSAKPVHRVRTSTRRIEAQMELLAQLPDLPGHQVPAQKVRRKLAKLRRAAGSVRDLDVLRDKLKKPEEEPSLWRGSPLKEMREEGKKLDKSLRHQRQTSAEELLSLLRMRQGSTTRVLEEFLQILEPAQAFSLSQTRLVEIAIRWFNERTPPVLEDLKEDQMHDLRKSAKLVRYLLESAPKEARKAQSLAKRFEELQRCGGHWHDLLKLAQQARKTLGKSSHLAKCAVHARDKSLTTYREEINKTRAAEPSRA